MKYCSRARAAEARELPDVVDLRYRPASCGTLGTHFYA